MPQYHAPPAKELAQRMAAAKLALDDLTPDARTEIEGMMFNLRRLEGIGGDAALEIIAALAFRMGQDDALDGAF